MNSIWILALILLIVIILSVRYNQTAITEFFKNRQPKVYDNGNININRVFPKYSANVNFLLENNATTATYNTIEKDSGKTYNNYQVFNGNLLIKDGNRYFLANYLQPQAIYELTFELKKISKNPVSEDDFDRLFNTVNNYIKKDINLVGPNMDVAPATVEYGIEQPSPIPKRSTKGLPKPVKSKKDTLKEGSTRLDKPDKNKLLEINYYNRTPQYIELDNNRNMLATNKEGVTFRTVCDSTKEKCPQEGEVIKPTKDTIRAQKLSNYETKLDRKQKIKSSSYYKTQQAIQCVQYMALKGFQNPPY